MDCFECTHKEKARISLGTNWSNETIGHLQYRPLRGITKGRSGDRLTHDLGHAARIESLNPLNIRNDPIKNWAIDPADL